MYDLVSASVHDSPALQPQPSESGWALQELESTVTVINNSLW